MDDIVIDKKPDRKRTSIKRRALNSCGISLSDPDGIHGLIIYLRLTYAALDRAGISHDARVDIAIVKSRNAIRVIENAEGRYKIRERRSGGKGHAYPVIHWKGGEEGRLVQSATMLGDRYKTVQPDIPANTHGIIELPIPADLTLDY
jgi:hypothetical protein